MIKNKIVYILLACVMMASTLGAAAQESCIGEIVLENTVLPDTVESETGEIAFNFEPTSTVSSRKRFTAVILKYGVTAQQFSDLGSADDVAAIMQSNEEGGKVRFNANISSEPSGKHIIIVSYFGAKSENNDKTKEFTFINPYKLPDEAVSVILRINACIKQNDASGIVQIFNTEEDVKSIAELYGERILNAGETVCTYAAKAVIAKGAFEQEDGNIFYSDLERFTASVNEAFAAGEMNMAQKPEQVKSAIAFYNEKYYKIESDFSQQNIEDIYSNMCNREISGIDKVAPLFEFAKLKSDCTLVNYSNVYDYISNNKSALTAINETKFNSVSDKSAFGMYLMNLIPSCQSIDDIVTAINNYSNSGSGGNGGGSGGGSGGSGGGSSISVGTSVIETIKTEKENNSLFSDVDKTHWAYGAIEYLYGKGAVSGYENGSFNTENTVTRAEFVTMAVKLFNIASEAENTFSDVTSADWYCGSVVAAAQSGLVMGNSDGQFKPDLNITRQEIAVILSRRMEKENITLAPVNKPIVFGDADLIANWAFESVAKLMQAGIISGDTAGNFMPLKNATRAEAAAMLYRFATAERAETNAK